MITMTVVAETVGIRLPVGSAYVRVWKQERPSVITPGGFDLHNSTGVSVEERCHT